MAIGLTNRVDAYEEWVLSVQGNNKSVSADFHLFDRVCD